MSDIHAVAASYEAERTAATMAALREENARLRMHCLAERERAEFWKGHHEWSDAILAAYNELLAKCGDA